MNPFESALRTAGNYLGGKTVVNNAANPASAYSMAKRNQMSGTKKLNPQAQGMQKSMKATQSLIKAGKSTGLK